MLVCVAIVALAATAYGLSPGELVASGDVAVRVAVSLLLLAAAIVLAVRSIWRSEYPVLRAVETLTAIVTVVVVTFASTYVLMSGSNAGAFSEPLDHTGALYFALTTSTTVGFGDISPANNTARIVVMIQMVTNVIVIGVVARLLLGTARRRVRSG